MKPKYPVAPLDMVLASDMFEPAEEKYIFKVFDDHGKGREARELYDKFERIKEGKAHLEDFSRWSGKWHAFLKSNWPV